MNLTKLFSLIAVVSVCAAAPARAQYNSGTRPSTPTTVKSEGNKTESSTNKKSGGKQDTAGAKSSGPTQNVDVNIAGTGVSIGKKELAAGRIIFAVQNASDAPHKIALEGGSLKALTLDVGVNGNGKMEADLAPGAYKVSCQTSGHHDAAAKFTVK